MLRASAAALALGGLFTVLATTVSSSALGQESVTIGIDADPTDNTATSLGEIDSCVAVSAGDSFDVDVFVQNVDDLLAWEAYLSFDPERLRVIDRDGDQFLASVPDSSPFDISASVPNEDGRYRVGAANISDPPTGGSGSGVLARLTLEAIESGIVSLALTPIETEVGTVGLTMTAVDGSQIGDSDGDSFFDGPLVDAQVAIDEACPGGAGPADAEADDDDGIAWWVFALVAIAGVVVIGLGGALLIFRGRTGPG